MPRLGPNHGTSFSLLQVSSQAESVCKWRANTWQREHREGKEHRRRLRRVLEDACLGSACAKTNIQSCSTKDSAVLSSGELPILRSTCMIDILEDSPQSLGPLNQNKVWIR